MEGKMFHADGTTDTHDEACSRSSKFCERAYKVCSLNDYKTSQVQLTLTLLTWTKWWAPASASKWQMGFNSAFKGLIKNKHTSVVRL